VTVTRRRRGLREISRELAARGGVKVGAAT
jgi:hypothetical protein